MKTAKSSLEAANQVVPKIEVNEAIQKHALRAIRFLSMFGTEQILPKQVR